MPAQNISPVDHPQAVRQEIERLAQHIVVARKLGVSQPTMARIERGDPSVAMASYVMCLWLINPALGLADLVAPENDHAALEREVARMRQPRKPRGAAAAEAPRASAAREPGTGRAVAAGLSSLMAAPGKKPT